MKSQQELTKIAKKAWHTRRKNLDASFAFKNHESKNEFRKKKAQEYKNSGITDGFLLLMPSQTCADIKVINELIPKNRYTFVGVENNKKTLAEIKKSKTDFLLFPGQMGDIVKHTKNDFYSHVDLDLCGALSNHSDTLIDTLQNDIVKVGGTVAMTFCLRDHGIADFTKKLVGIKKYRQFNEQRAVVVNTLKILISKYGGHRYKYVVAPQPYRSSKEQAPMLFAMLKRVK